MSMRLRSLVTAALVYAPLVAVAAQSEQTSDFKWSEQIAAGRWLRVHDINGTVTVKQGTGSRVEVTAVKRWRRGNPEDVRIEAKKDGEDIIVCALWGKSESCEDNRNNRGRNNDRWNWNDRDDDVAVDFTILMPRGIRLNANTVNGGIDVSGATSDVEISSVNGRITAEAGAGPFSASTVNGSVHARITADAAASTMNFSTVNGSVIAELPPNFGADVGLTTVNGSLRSDYDISVRGRIDPRHLSAHVGAAGGPRISLTTVNGDIELRKP